MLKLFLIALTRSGRAEGGPRGFLRGTDGG